MSRQESVTGVTLAIDIGGTSIRTALLENGDTVLDRESQPTASAPLAAVVTASVARILGRNPERARELESAGVGVPEYVRGGRVTSTEVIAWTDDLPELIAECIADATGRRIVISVESDVRCGAIAEHSALPDPETQSLLYVSWGTGISSTLVLPGGQCWEGARGEALALGEWRGTTADGEPQRLEDVASGAGIARRFGEQRLSASSALTPSAATTEEVSRLADRGDDGARALLESAGNELGAAIAELVDVLDPHSVVIGGGLGSTYTIARRALFERYAAAERRPGRATIAAARYGQDSGIIGAGLIGRAARAGAPGFAARVFP